MKKIEQLHLKAAGGCDEYEHDLELASKSAKITEDVAIGFAEWLSKYGYESCNENWMLNGFCSSTKELFQEFLKTLAT